MSTNGFRETLEAFKQVLSLIFMNVIGLVVWYYTANMTLLMTAFTVDGLVLGVSIWEGKIKKGIDVLYDVVGIIPTALEIISMEKQRTVIHELNKLNQSQSNEPKVKPVVK